MAVCVIDQVRPWFTPSSTVAATIQPHEGAKYTKREVAEYYRSVADWLLPELARRLVDEGARIIFVPFCTDNRQGYMRVRYCAQARAVENQCFVVMSGNVGNLPGVDNMDIQYAQSCILTPCDFPFARDGIAAEASENIETLTIADVNLADLTWARAEGTVRNLTDRRFDLYRIAWSKKPRGGKPQQPHGRPMEQKGPGGG